MKEISPMPFCSKCKNSVFCAPNNPIYEVGDNLKSRKFLSFSANEYLYKTGEKAKGIFCIYSGGVRIFKSDKLYREFTVHHTSEGEIFGFHSISEGRYNNSATATEETSACFIPLSAINQLIIELSTVTEKILSSKY
jgi:CRP-like cAMP-binding protein